MTPPHHHDVIWALLFALVTALSNALALAAQHSANARAPRALRGARLWRFLLVQPLWLFGWLTLGASLASQALALHFGPLAVVQPVLVCELVFALLLRRFLRRRRLAKFELGGTVLAVGGLIIFLVCATPQPGVTEPDGTQWVWGITAVVSVVLATVLAANHGSERVRASSFGAATGLLWAVEATFIKSATDVMVRHGPFALLEHWPLYGVVVAGVAGLLCEQRALHAGPLRYSQPLIVIVDPLASVALGLALYHERITGGLALDAVALGGLVAMSFGIIAATRTDTAVIVASGS